MSTSVVAPANASRQTSISSRSRTFSPDQQSGSTNIRQEGHLFCRLDQKLVEEFLRSGLPRHFLPGEFVCRQGEPATNLHMITIGKVKLFGCTSSGIDALFKWCHAGDVVGVGALVSPPCPYVWNAQASETTDTLTWDLMSIKVLGAQKEMLYQNALSIAIQWAHSLQERFQEMATEKVEQRLAHLVLHLSFPSREHQKSCLDINISNEELAQMAGTNPYTVNRILNRWERDGYIEKGRKWFRVCDEKSVTRISAKAGLATASDSKDRWSSNNGRPIKIGP